MSWIDWLQLLGCVFGIGAVAVLILALLMSKSGMG